MGGSTETPAERIGRKRSRCHVCNEVFLVEAGSGHDCPFGAWVNE